MSRRTWRLAHEQHGVITRSQLLALGLSPKAIKHRAARGRLHPLYRGVFAVGRRDLTQYGRWIAAVLSCGTDAVLSHSSAAALWGFGTEASRIELSVSGSRFPRRPGISVHRRTTLPQDVTHRHGIPVTTPVATLIDLATRLSRQRLEAAISEADKLNLTDPERLRSALAALPSRRGVPALRELLDRQTFRLTDSELERRFLRIVREAGLPVPQTGRNVNGFKVDFYWPDLGLVVETDGLRYHRTPTQQAKDRLRDQAHVASGLTCLRFTHAQVRFDSEHVRETLAGVVALRAHPPKARAQ